MAHRPPISLPRTTVSAAVLEELISEIGSLASVYHKPAETFVGKGRMGAESLRKNILESVLIIPIMLNFSY
jgi:AP-1 complex subunit beta-1